MNWKLAGSIALYVASIVLANVMTARLGLVPVGFGLLVTAGTYAAGFALLARDIVHRFGGWQWAVVAILVGGALSWALSTPALAVASTVAFVGAEAVDMLVYVPLRRRSFAAAVLASNAVAAPIDTVLFLAIAGFPLTWEVVGGQLLGKLLWATIVPLTLWLCVRRAVLREPEHARSA